MFCFARDEVVVSTNVFVIKLAICVGFCQQVWKRGLVDNFIYDNNEYIDKDMTLSVHIILYLIVCNDVWCVCVLTM